MSNNFFNMLDVYMWIYILVVLVYLFSCLKLYEDRRKLERERMELYREIEKTELWLERKAKELEAREDRLNARIRDYKYLTK